MRGVYGNARTRIGAESAPVRQALTDAIAKLQQERQAIAARIREDEGRMKIALDLQGQFPQPIADDFSRQRFEALQHESSRLAQDLAVAQAQIAALDARIAEASARVPQVELDVVEVKPIPPGTGPSVHLAPGPPPPATVTPPPPPPPPLPQSLSELTWSDLSAKVKHDWEELPKPKRTAIEVAAYAIGALAVTATVIAIARR